MNHHGFGDTAERIASRKIAKLEVRRVPAVVVHTQAKMF
jgi:hypothetical protein